MGAQETYLRACYKDTCSLASKHVTGMKATSTGHHHVVLDGALVNMFCTPMP